jgi:hypothetical protein
LDDDLEDDDFDEDDEEVDLGADFIATGSKSSASFISSWTLPPSSNMSSPSCSFVSSASI